MGYISIFWPKLEDGLVRLVAFLGLSLSLRLTSGGHQKYCLEIHILESLKPSILLKKFCASCNALIFDS